MSASVVVAKPWGQEVVFADGEHGYVGKLITVRAGHALSLQFHRQKVETITVVSGQAVYEHGLDTSTLETITLEPGDTVHVPTHTLHRMTAVTDTLLAEVSTAGEGWREDVVRLDDRYGRTSTSAP